MILFETSVLVARPVDEVFAYVSEVENFPRWNSAVRTVQRTSGKSKAGSRFTMGRDLPSGRAENELEVTVDERPTTFAIRTVSGPTPFVYRYTFSERDGTTLIQLDAEVELGGVAELLGPLARRAVKAGVDDNLTTLKVILESRLDA